LLKYKNFLLFGLRVSDNVQLFNLTYQGKGMLRRTLGLVSALWGLIGVSVLLGGAVVRLTPWALEALRMDLAWHHWSLMLVCVAFMGYSEGYVGFQRGFSPRVAARARYLREHPTLVRAVAAPLFCMGFFHAQRRRLIISYSLTLGIIVLILLVRLLPQPWRGIVDAGVVVGLAWGFVALLVFAVQGLKSGDYDYSPEVSEVE
jgi:hypothetical protein